MIQSTKRLRDGKINRRGQEELLMTCLVDVGIQIDVELNVIHE